MDVLTGPTANLRRLRDDLTPPPWACELAGDHLPIREEDGFELAVAQGTAASLITVQVDLPAAVDAACFEQRTWHGYQLIRRVLGTLPHHHPVRFWNHLPGIHRPMGDGRDRYVVFNAGRFKAFREWFDRPDQLPAASAVGHEGLALVIHCLALDRPGIAMENPRQIPAFRYSARYGLLPPCFARATIVPDLRAGTAAMLLAAGTASIRGEQSMHVDDLRRQLDETLVNLRKLLETAQPQTEEASTLAAFSDLRVYFVRDQDSAFIEKYVIDAFGTQARQQFIRADLCRSDLLVEIEGLAKLERWKKS